MGAIPPGFVPGTGVVAKVFSARFKKAEKTFRTHTCSRNKSGWDRAHIATCGLSRPLFAGPASCRRHRAWVSAKRAVLLGKVLIRKTPNAIRRDHTTKEICSLRLAHKPHQRTLIISPARTHNLFLAKFNSHLYLLDRYISLSQSCGSGDTCTAFCVKIATSGFSVT